LRLATLPGSELAAMVLGGERLAHQMFRNDLRAVFTSSTLSVLFANLVSSTHMLLLLGRIGNPGWN